MQIFRALACSTRTSARCEDMRGMFLRAATFNQPLGRWNVTLVKDVTSMFEEAAAFAQDLCWALANETLDLAGVFQGSAAGRLKCVPTLAPTSEPALAPTTLAHTTACSITLRPTTSRPTRRGPAARAGLASKMTVFAQTHITLMC